MVAKHFKDNMSGQTEDNSSHSNRTNKSEDHRGHFNKDAPGTDLWTNGLICAFEFVRGRKKHAKSRSYSKNVSVNPGEGESTRNHLPTHGISKTSAIKSTGNSLTESPPLIELGSRQVGSMDDSFENEVPQADPCFTTDRYEGSHWVPIGWSRISELVQGIEVNAGWSAPHLELLDEEDDVSVADLAAPYWERPGGPVWWCHVVAGHPYVDSWLTNAQWLHPAISIALKDESRLISDRMRHLLYEVDFLFSHP
ncbi:transporter [Lithospermum erythrorhizon]|uniref:Transporter n=1 Tax=Lithospermum erythrorhizon TaxID=34254 RepID=A0AAV3P828_LITER